MPPRFEVENFDFKSTHSSFDICMRYPSGNFSGLIFNSFVDSFGFHSIDQRHILIQEHFLTSYFQYAFLDYFYIKRLIHIGIVLIFLPPLPAHAGDEVRHGKAE